MFLQPIRMVLPCTVISLLCALAAAGQGAAGPFEVGQRWVYEHEGPRPGGMEPNAIDGQRILHVVGVVGEPNALRWVIEERYTNGPNVVGRLYVDTERLLTGFDIENDKGEVAPLRYDPPVPYQILEMEIGQKQTVETTLHMPRARFEVPTTLVIERLEDEAVTTPAGEFVGCRHYKVVNNSTFDIKIAKVPLTEQRERWYHPQVNGLVKEVYTKGPVKFLTWSRPGYTATSVLASFGKAEVPPGSLPAAPATGPPATGDPESDDLSSGPVLWLLLGGVAILVPGLVAWRRRRRPKGAVATQSPVKS